MMRREDSLGRRVGSAGSDLGEKRVSAVQMQRWFQLRVEQGGEVGSVVAYGAYRFEDLMNWW